MIFAQANNTELLAQSDGAIDPLPEAPLPVESAPQDPTEFLNYILVKLKGAFLEMADSAINAFPSLVIALILLFVGVVASKVIRAVLTGTFKKIKLDEIFAKIGLTEIFSKIGLKAGPSVAIPKLIYWLLLLFFVKIAADAANLTEISNLIDRVMAFLPKVLTSSIILLIGFIVADLIRNAAFNSLDNIGLEYAGSVSRILFGFIFILVLTVAFSQLGIETELLNSSVKIILAGLALAVAIALGLGLKTLAGQVVSGVYAKDLYKVGTELHYDDRPAKVAGVGPVTTKLIRDDGSFIIVPNSLLITEVVRGRTEN